MRVSISVSQIWSQSQSYSVIRITASYLESKSESELKSISESESDLKSMLDLESDSALN